MTDGVQYNISTDATLGGTEEKKREIEIEVTQVGAEKASEQIDRAARARESVITVTQKGAEEVGDAVADVAKDAEATVTVTQKGAEEVKNKADSARASVESLAKAVEAPRKKIEFKNESLNIDQMFQFAEASKKVDDFRKSLLSLGLPREKVREAVALIDGMAKKIDEGTASAQELTDFGKQLGASLKGLDGASLDNIAQPFDSARASVESLAESLDPSLSRSMKKVADTSERLDEAMGALSGDTTKIKDGLTDFAARIPMVQRAMEAFSKIGPLWTAAISAVSYGVNGLIGYIREARQRAEQIKLDNIERSLESISEQSQTIVKIADWEYAAVVRTNEAYAARINTLRQIANAQLEIAKARELAAVEPGTAAAEAIEQRYEREAETGADNDAETIAANNLKGLEDSLAREKEKLDTLNDDYDGYRDAMNDARKLHERYAKEATATPWARLAMAGAAGVGGAATGAVVAGGFAAGAGSLIPGAGTAVAGSIGAVGGGVFVGVKSAMKAWELASMSAEQAEENMEAAAAAMEKAGAGMQNTASAIEDAKVAIDDIKQKIDDYTRQFAAQLETRAAKANAYASQGEAAYRSATAGAGLRMNEEQWTRNLAEADSSRLADALNERRDELKSRAETYRTGGTDVFGNSVRGIEDLRRELEQSAAQFKAQKDVLKGREAELAEALKKQAQGIELSGIEPALIAAHNRVNELGKGIAVVSGELKTNAKAYEEHVKALRDFEREMLSALKSRYDEGKSEEIAGEERDYNDSEAERARRMSRLGREDRYREGETRAEEAKRTFDAADKELKDEADRRRLEYLDEKRRQNANLKEGERGYEFTDEEKAFESGLSEERKAQLRGMGPMSDERKRTLERDRQRSHGIVEAWKSEREQIDLEREQEEWQRRHDMDREDEAYARGRSERLGGSVAEEAIARKELARGERDYKTADDLLDKWMRGIKLGLDAEKRKALGLTKARPGEESILSAEDERRLKLMRSEARGRITDNRDKLDQKVIERADKMADFGMATTRRSNRLTEMGLGGGADGYSWGKDTAANTRLTAKGIGEMIRILRGGMSGRRIGITHLTWGMK